MRSKPMRWLAVSVAAALLAGLVAGCGGQPRSDLDLFIMPDQAGLPNSAAKQVKEALLPLFEGKTVSVTGSPIYNREKLFVEIAAVDHDILILPKDDFASVAQQGGAVPLDDTLDKAAYPDGVLAGQVAGPDGKDVTETHLFGVPVKASPLLVGAGLPDKGGNLFMVVFSRSKNKTLAKQAIKEMTKR